MTQPDNRLHPHLPVTAEVGGEGGSFSDPTHQVATFQNDLPRADGRASGAERSALSDRSEEDHGFLRYPTEATAPPHGADLRGRTAANWRAGLVGAAAGAAAVLGIGLLRRRR